MHPCILALATAVPPHAYSQEDILTKMSSILAIPQDKELLVKRIYENSAISKRHSVTDDFVKPRTEWHFWGFNYPQTVPNMAQRNAVYKQQAPSLALEAAAQAIKNWGGSPKEITHIISVSCTGVMAPGIEYLLMQSLHIPSTANRLGINFMGCFGAFKGLSVAKAFAQENPRHRVLVVCTELCSLHLQAKLDSDNLTANSLFADGAAAAVVGADPTATEIPLWEMVRTHSLGMENSLDKMSWEASENGFVMRLSHTVPVLIGRHIAPFVEQLCAQNTVSSACDWAIHPGGKSIIQAIERALQLKEEQTRVSWEILANYGNMSSATFLFILHQMAQQEKQMPWTIGLAFGPGLSIEGLLLRKPQEAIA